jgi:lysophospholipase L1-like esterase
MGENVRKMISLAAERDIPVVLLGVPRPGLFLSSADIYEEIADTMGVVFIEDLIPDVLSDKSLKSDVAHPNQHGYERIAKSIYDVLQDLGAI